MRPRLGLRYLDRFAVIRNIHTVSGRPRLRNANLISKVLTRDFIHDSLYNPSFGYFNHNAKILQFEPINFKNLSGHKEYEKLLASFYHVESSEAREHFWHTPVELFKVRN